MRYLKLTPQERNYYVEQLKECNKADIELAHCIADDILCEILTKLGYDDIVKEFEALEKWYA